MDNKGSQTVHELSLLFFGGYFLIALDQDIIKALETGSVESEEYFFFQDKCISKSRIRIRIPLQQRNWDKWKASSRKLVSSWCGNCISLYLIPAVNSWHLPPSASDRVPDTRCQFLTSALLAPVTGSQIPAVNSWHLPPRASDRVPDTRCQFLTSAS